MALTFFFPRAASEAARKSGRRSPLFESRCAQEQARAHAFLFLCGTGLIVCALTVDRRPHWGARDEQGGGVRVGLPACRRPSPAPFAASAASSPGIASRGDERPQPLQNKTKTRPTNNQTTGLPIHIDPSLTWSPTTDITHTSRTDQRVQPAAAADRPHTRARVCRPRARPGAQRVYPRLPAMTP